MVGTIGNIATTASKATPLAHKGASVLTTAPAPTTGYVAMLADPIADSIAAARTVLDDLKQQGLVTKYQVLEEVGMLTFQVPTAKESAALQALRGISGLTDIQSALR